MRHTIDVRLSARSRDEESVEGTAARWRHRSRDHRYLSGDHRTGAGRRAGRHEPGLPGHVQLNVVPGLPGRLKQCLGLEMREPRMAVPVGSGRRRPEVLPGGVRPQRRLLQLVEPVQLVLRLAAS